MAVIGTYEPINAMGTADTFRVTEESNITYTVLLFQPDYPVTGIYTLFCVGNDGPVQFVHGDGGFASSFRVFYCGPSRWV